MNIRIIPHALERARERGASEEEIRDTLENGFPIKVKHGRYGKAKIYDFNRLWSKKFYEQKRIEVIYTIEGDAIIVITVYVFYGKWSDAL